VSVDKIQCQKIYNIYRRKGKKTRVVIITVKTVKMDFSPYEENINTVITVDTMWNFNQCVFSISE